MIIKKYETPGGKQLTLSWKGNNIVASFSSGNLPQCLSGCWTDLKSAEKSVLLYMDKYVPKDKKKATEKLGLNPEDYKR